MIAFFILEKMKVLSYPLSLNGFQFHQPRWAVVYFVFKISVNFNGKTFFSADHFFFLGVYFQIMD